MIRRLTAILLSLLMLTCLTVSVSAQESFRVIDDAVLLTPDEISYLEEVSSELKEQYHIDAVIVTVGSLKGKSPQNFADDYYDNSGYSKDGTLLLLAMEEREWYISTSGSMIYTLTDYGIQQIGDRVLVYLSEGLWFDAFCEFLFALPEYLDAYEKGSPIDGYADYSGNYYHGEQEEILYYEEEFHPRFGISLLCGIVVAGIVVLIMRGSMNTKRPQHGASEYMSSDSWKVTQHRDQFLYSKVTKTAREQSTSSSGGGSSVHRSSGGRKHGGGGGKF